MKTNELNSMILPVRNEGKILVNQAYYPLKGYYSNLLYTYKTIEGHYVMCDIVI
jgi:hypothetical protein